MDQCLHSVRTDCLGTIFSMNKLINQTAVVIQFSKGSQTIEFVVVINAAILQNKMLESVAISFVRYIKYE